MTWPRKWAVKCFTREIPGLRKRHKCCGKLVGVVSLLVVFCLGLGLPAKAQRLPGKPQLPPSKAQPPAVRTLSGHTDEVVCVAFSPDGRHGLSGDKRGILRMWDLDAATELRSFALGFGPVAAACFSDDGRMIHAVAANAKSLRVRVWDSRSGKPGNGSTDAARGGTKKPNPLILALARGGEQLIVLETASGPTGAKACKLEAVDLSDVTAPRNPIVETNARPVCMAVSRDGSKVITGGGPREAALRLWDLKESKVEPFGPVTNGSQCVALSPDGRHVLTGSDRHIQIWDLTSVSATRLLKGHTKSVTSVAISPDGQRALSGSLDKTIRLWDVGTGQQLSRLEGHTEPVRTVLFSPDGKWALSGGADRSVRLWELPLAKATPAKKEKRRPSAPGGRG
jgi:WD40 repeat protein